jgi:hypothetical protein
MTKFDSIFDADCPRCGRPLETTVTDTVVEGLIWRCSECGFVSERSGAILIDVLTEPQPADR